MFRSGLRKDNNISKFFYPLSYYQHYPTFLLVFVLVCMPVAQSMDERFFRGMFSGEIKKEKEEVLAPMYKWTVKTDFYHYDLDGDSFPEYFQMEKRDGEDWFKILDWNKKPFFQHKLEKLGPGSWPYKLSISKISKTVKLVVIHFFQGSTKYIDFYGRSILYFLTIEDQNLEKISFQEGPATWEEVEEYGGHYTQRFYNLNFEDYNGDGIKEIAVNFNKSFHLYGYKGDGKWREIK